MRRSVIVGAFCALCVIPTLSRSARAQTTIDFEAISSKTSTLQDQFAGIQVSDLPGLTTEIYDLRRSCVSRPL